MFVFGGGGGVCVLVLFACLRLWYCVCLMVCFVFDSGCMCCVCCVCGMVVFVCWGGVGVFGLVLLVGMLVVCVLA